jgi:hypothetical protein
MNRSTLIIVAGVVFAVGAIGGAFGQRILGKQTVALPGPQSGRYQIVFSPHLRADTFLLDTATGRIWSPEKYTSYEGDPTAWTVQPRLDGKTAEGTWLQGETLKVGLGIRRRTVPEAKRRVPAVYGFKKRERPEPYGPPGAQDLRESVGSSR